MRLGPTFTESGLGSLDIVGPVTPQDGDLSILGVSGAAKDAPYSAGSHERRTSTGDGDSGPFTDGEGYGTFSSADRTGTFTVAATLNPSAAWNALVVGIPPTKTPMPALGASVAHLAVALIPLTVRSR